LLCRSDASIGDFPIPFDARRNGSALGEGAALLMLEDAALARERGARVLGEIKGHGSSYDCSRGHNDKTSIEAIASAIRQALNDAFLLPHEVDCLSASANGSVAGDRHEAQGVFVGLNGQTGGLPVTAIKSMLGETLGASGPMQAVALLETMRDGVLPGILRLEKTEDGFPLKMARAESQEADVTNGLINSIGFDGHCCSLIVTRPDEP
jgi:3-oxoacyl-[acyl-carrier-protein] synthase II